MFLIRLRILFKKALLRDSALYRLCRFVYRNVFRLWPWCRKPNHPHRIITDNSIFTMEEEMEMCSIFPKEILDLTVDLFRPLSVLDVGCGTGISLDYFQSKGINVQGLEGSDLAISKARNADLIAQCDLNQPIRLERRFDLVWCFEVAEHIHPEYVENFLETLTNHGNRILLSAARPGQGGLGHFNEQPAEYWLGKMAERGFVLDAQNTSKYRALPDHFAGNILVFVLTKS